MPFAIFSEAGESALFSSYAKTSVTVGAVVAVACMFLGSLALAIAMLVAGISKLEWANP
jgi:voltage-gated potassium channel Kch